MLISSSAYAHGFSNKKKYISGRGFVDSLSSVIQNLSKQFLSTAIPALKNIGKYVVENRDLIVKPVLGAVDSLAAAELSAGVPAILKHIARRSKKDISQTKTAASTSSSIAAGDTAAASILASDAEKLLETANSAKYKEILRNIVGPSNPVSNIIGSGIKTF